MQNAHYPAAGAAPAAGAEIVTVWDVHEGPAYDVPRSREGNPYLILWRTHAGAGELWMDDGRHFLLEPGSVLLVESDRMRRYRTYGASWDFWWFQMRLEGPLPLPPGHPITVPEHPRDRADFAEMIRLMTSPAAQERCLASAIFGMMLHRWIAAWSGFRQTSPQRARMDAIIRALHASGETPQTVGAMARACHLGVRRFRQLFREATGTSPKAFQDNIRLLRARESLAMGMGNVGETATAFGFASAFHFSRAFRRRFGFPPSELLRILDGKESRSS